MSKKARSILLLTVTSILATLGLIEFTLRLLRPNSTFELYVWQPYTCRKFSPDASLPGLSESTRFTINKDGLRGETFEQPHTLRILTVGGSTTECLYLDDKETWPQLLQTILRSRNLDAWAASCGRSGRTAVQHQLDFEKLLPQFPKVDIVTILVGVNDLHSRLMYGHTTAFTPTDLREPEQRRKLEERSFFKEENHNSLRLISFLNYALNTACKSQTNAVIQDRKGDVFIRLCTARSLSKQNLELPDMKSALLNYEDTLHNIIDIALHMNQRIIFMTQPSIWRPDLSTSEKAHLWMGGIGDFFRTPTDTYYSVDALAEGMKLFNDTLLKVSKERNVEIIDLANSVPKTLEYFYDDIHFNRGGAQVVASCLAKYILEHREEHPKYICRNMGQIQASSNLNFRIEDWGPKVVTHGTTPLPQPNGEGALWFKLTPSPDATWRVTVSGIPLSTTRSTNIWSASISKELLNTLFATNAELAVDLVSDQMRLKRKRYAEHLLPDFERP